MQFEKKISSSKSLVNRYLILRDSFPDLNLDWQSQAEDVLNLEQALNSYRNKKELYVGEGGTTLRFLATYLSSKKGEWVLKGKPSLFLRPQKELCDVLESLGAQTSLSSNSLTIKSEGWIINEIRVDAIKTTQVLTGVVLTALTLNKEFKVFFKNLDKSSGYFELTIGFLKQLGFSFSCEENIFSVTPLEKPLLQNIDQIEADWSSAAFLYVLGSLLGEVEVLNLESKSLQPDASVLAYLQEAGVLVEGLKVKKQKSYTPLHKDLRLSPDLFPVLAVFSCFCEGESKLFGAPQLIYKESNRIEKIQSLLTCCGYETQIIDGGLKINGQGDKVLKHRPFSFDVLTDHRLFMAAEILKRKGYAIEILGEESLKKSFPEYLNWRKEL